MRQSSGKRLTTALVLLLATAVAVPPAASPARYAWGS